MIVMKGATRTVILTKKYAIKFPFTFYPCHGYRGFWYRLLRGLLANIQEREFSGYKIHGITMNDVVFYICGGILIVSPRADKIDTDTFIMLQRKKRIGCFPDIVECKRDSFGIINGKIVAIDYGS